MVSQRVKIGLLTSCGAGMVAVGAIMVVLWPSLYMTELQKRMTLSPESMSFDIWRETPIPMYLECFFFNVTNVEDILAGRDVRVQVEQIGPYVYREEHSKQMINWNTNSTVTFYNQRWWYFEPDMSNGSLSDMVTTINPIIATIAYSMRHNRAVTNVIVDSFVRLYHRNMFTTANVSQWLFEGVDDPILDVAERIPFLPIEIPYDRFGWFYTRNGSVDYDGIFVMNTGADDFSNLGNVERWRYSNRTVYRDECGDVKGSTGELWAPEIGQQEVTIFAPDICSYMTLSEDGEVEIEGLEGVQYAANDSVFDNGYHYPHTACYCDEVRDSNCVPSGALNVSACRFGAPAFVSLPHFLHSDPYYPSKIEGLDPTPDHSFRLSLEMFTGMPLSVAAQLQINLLIRHVSGMSIANALPDGDVLFPMFWFRQEVRTTPQYAQMALSALRLRYWVPYGLYGLTAIGVIVLMWGVVILTKRILKSPDTAPILENTPEDQPEQ